MQRLDPPGHPPPTSGHELVLAGRYQVFQVLGRGGMASVHRGHDDRLDRPVAVKLLHEHLADDERVRDRFRREAQAAARLNHRGVVAVYDHWTGGEDDPPFLVMELVDGGSVRDVLATRGTLGPGQALALLRPAMVGLAHAHATGIVHRDVTPANILVTRDGASKLGDFGLARAAAASTQTFPEGVVGSPHYMSPEAVGGQPLDARSDVYSLGCVLYECLAGRPPFDGDSPQAIATRHGTDPVPPPSASDPSIPRALDAVVARATAPDPGDRFADAGAMVAAFDRAVPDGPVAIDLRDGTRQLRIDPVHATTTLDDDPVTVAVVDRPPPRWRRWLAVLATLAALAGGSWIAWDQLVAPVTPIPAVAGQSVDVATETLQDAGFDVVVAQDAVNDVDVPAGAVLAQDHTGEARRGTVVTLTRSAGPRTGALPVLANREVDDARAAVEDLGLDLAVVVVEAHDDDAPAGRVLSSRPAAGEEVVEASTVELTVSKGPAPVAVPDVVGEPRARATAALEDLGLVVGGVEERHDDEVPQGHVVAVTPAAGTELRRGDEVALTVSLGPAPVTVPDVRGLAEDEAVEQLRAAGLEVEVVDVPRILPLGIGTVDDQAPSPEQVRPRGSTVSIFVWRQR